MYLFVLSFVVVCVRDVTATFFVTVRLTILFISVSIDVNVICCVWGDVGHVGSNVKATIHSFVSQTSGLGSAGTIPECGTGWIAVIALEKQSLLIRISSSGFMLVADKWTHDSEGWRSREISQLGSNAPLRCSAALQPVRLIPRQ